MTSDADHGDHGVSTDLPCPAWCDLPAGHPLHPATDSGDRHPDHCPDQGQMFRVHERRFGARPTHVVAEAWERAATAAGPTDLGADPEAYLIRLQLPAGHGYLTSTGARRLADLLTQAADTIDTPNDPHIDPDDLTTRRDTP